MKSKVGALAFYALVAITLTFAFPPTDLKVKAGTDWPERSLGAAAEEVLKAE